MPLLFRQLSVVLQDEPFIYLGRSRRASEALRVFNGESIFNAPEAPTVLATLVLPTCRLGNLLKHRMPQVSSGFNQRNNPLSLLFALQSSASLLSFLPVEGRSSSCPLPFFIFLNIARRA
jgi:hypothetical protein